MTTDKAPAHTRWICGASIAGLLLVGCNRPAPPAQPQEPAPAPTAAPAAPESVAPAEAPAAAPEAPAAAPAAGAAAPPEVARMVLAQAGGKAGVPVQLRYQFDGDPMTGQAVTLHLAVIPQVAGSNLAVSIKQEAGIVAKASVLNVQKAGVSTAYRQQLAITRQAGAGDELRVLVTMDLPEGSAFGYFSVPFSRAPAAAKQADIRQQ